jgi:hypothetical protein
MHVPSLLIRGCGFVVLLMAALWAGPVAAATCTSTTAGNWNVTTTWDCGIVPDGDDDVVIAANVTLTDAGDVNNLTINSGSTLTGISGKILSVFGNWTNLGGVFAHNGMDVDLEGSGTQVISGITTFDNLELRGGGSSKDFTSSQITIQDALIHTTGAMIGGTSTFIFQGSTSIGGGASKNFHNLIINGGVTHSSGTIFVSGALTINIGGSLGFTGLRVFRFNGTSPQTLSIASGGSVAFHGLQVESSAILNLPDLGMIQPSANFVTNTGVLRQSGDTSISTAFAYIRNSDDTPVYRGLDLVPTSGSFNALVGIAGNRSVCLNPGGYNHRNRCFGIRNTTAAPVTANVTLYTTAGEDDITGDKFYEYTGGTTWADRGVCPTGDGDACSATGIVLEPGDNHFLIGTSTPPTPVTLTTFTVTRAEDANHLAWETATEVNFAGFYVQRRPADGDFARIGDFVYAQGGPLSGASYTWTDTNLANGPYHYRLEAVDFDQSIEFFEPTSVEETRPNAGFSVYLPFSFK